MAETQQQDNIVLQAAKNLADGIPPTNAQIEETIDRATAVIDQQKQSGGLDSNTQVIAQDLKRVLVDTQRLLEEKNRDEKIQTFLLEAKLAAEQLAQEASNTDTGAVKDELKEAGKAVRPLQDEAFEVLQKIKSVIYEVMRSPSFRKAMINAIDLFQQVFWDQWQDKGKQVTEGIKTDLARGDGQMQATREAASDAGEKARQDVKSGDIGSYDAELRKQDLKRRLNELLREIGDSTEYTQAVNDLFDLAKKMRHRVEKAGKRVKSAAKETSFTENAHVTRMWEEGRLIIEEFTGHNRIKHLMDALTDLYEFIAEDERATKFFNDLKGYIQEGLENPKKLQVDNTIGSTETSVDEAYDKLYDEGRDLFKSEELRNRVHAVMDELHGMIKTARRDPASERLANSARALIRDLTVDPKTGKASLWVLRDNIEKSGRSLLLPVLLRELEIVPVKGIRGTTSTFDYAVRNLVFSAYDLLPERARFYMDLDVDIDLTEFKRSGWQEGRLDNSTGSDADINGEIVLRLDRIKTHVRDVEFHYIRKTFPQLEDWGRMDIDTVDNGARLEVRWRIMSPRGGMAPTVVGYKVFCGIDGLNVTIREAAKHELLDKMMSKLFAGQLKERVEREIERNLAAFASKVSLLFNDVFQGKLPDMAQAIPAISL